MLQADEVIAAITCRTKHHPIATFAQAFDRLYRQAARQRRAIAIDEQDTVMPGIEQRGCRAKQHEAQIIASLQQQSEPWGKQLSHDVFAVRRSIDAVAASAEHLRYCLDCG